MRAQPELPYCAATILPAASRPALLASALAEGPAADGRPSLDGGQVPLLLICSAPIRTNEPWRSSGLDVPTHESVPPSDHSLIRCPTTAIDEGDPSEACGMATVLRCGGDGPERDPRRVLDCRRPAHRTVKEHIIYGSPPGPTGGVIIATENRVHGVFIAHPTKRGPGTCAAPDNGTEGTMRRGGLKV